MQTLTLQQAAEILKMHPQTVRERAISGEIPDIEWTEGANADRYAVAGVAIELASVPEPATLALMGLGFVGFGYQWRRKVSS